MCKTSIPVFFLSLTIILNSCNDSSQKFSIDETLNMHISTKHFDYYMADDDKVDTTIQEKYFKWLLNELEVDTVEKITYYKLKDRKQIFEIIGYQTNAYANTDSNYLFTIWPIDNHECVHLVLCRNVGCPPALFGEGVAVAYQATLIDSLFVPGWNGENFHVLTKKYLLNDQLPSLDSLLGIQSFWNIDPNISYPVAGSLTRYLIDKYGIKKFKNFIHSRKYTDEPSLIKNRFNENYEQSISSLWNEWISFIERHDK